MFKKQYLDQLASDIKKQGEKLGFQQIAIAPIHLGEHTNHFKQWLQAGYQGEMSYMSQHGEKRTQPQLLVPGTTRIISLRMNYLPTNTLPIKRLSQKEKAYISCYAQGRDYHKLIRKRLQKLADYIQSKTSEIFGYRAFVDSAPVLERAFAEKAGLGWIGKNTLLINKKEGSFFFLAELFIDLALPIDTPYTQKHCGSCTACLTTCPTQAFTSPYVLDARLCISYLTIELKGAIPEHLRSLIGNRVFGCDDCQLVCPWNRFSQKTEQPDFHPRHQLDNSDLSQLFKWSEEEFLTRTEGSPIRRIGYERWLRNLAVGLGNAPTSIPIIETLKTRRNDNSMLVKEHVKWALEQHGLITEQQSII